MNYKKVGDPETHTRIQQFEMAFRMQASVPELMDVKSEPEATYKLYGDEAKKPGTFAFTACWPAGWSSAACASCRFITTTGTTTQTSAAACRRSARTSIRRPTALIQDLKARGMCDSTLIIWGGEFGRTIYSQGGLSKDNYGRDHHPRCFTMWLAGGGVKGGTIYGADRRFQLQHRREPGPCP